MRVSATRLLPALLCALPSLSACTRSADAGPARKVALKPCRLEGASRQALCGIYEVWEDRAAKKGRKVALKVASALAPSPETDPLVLLAGGPGQGRRSWPDG